MLPFIEYVLSDKTIYPLASESIDPRTDKNWVDEDNDFRIGNSGGFLMNWDFKFIDTHLFSEVAMNYEKNVKNPEISAWVEGLNVPRSEARNKYYYCPHIKGTPEYDAFWSRETYRRRNGLTLPCKLKNGKVYDLHISGAHYHYLNYGRILRTPTEEELKLIRKRGDFATKMIQGFPRFWDGDYWNFKIDLFISNNNFHLSKAKARGKGYSYKRGAQAANTANLVKFATVILAAYDISYLTDGGATSDMVKTNLDWLENNTHWRRFYISESLDNIELGYRTKKGGNKKFGTRSKILSVTLRNNPSAAIGKRAIEIDYEESGKCPNLEESLDVTLSSTEVGSSNVGTIRCYGTAGTKGADWQPFANVYYSPTNYKMMPFENVWDDNSRNSVCGFFHPQVLNMEPFIDADGNSLFLQAEEYDLKDKDEYALNNSVEKWLAYVGQRANKPSEAFKSVTQNIFSSPGLSKHVSMLQSNKGDTFYRDGMLLDEKGKIVFKTNAQLLNEGLKDHVHPYIEEYPFNPKKDFYGCIREYFPPFAIDGKIPDDLYVVVYDPVGKDKKSELVINKNSLNSIHVMMYPNNISNSTGDMLVASYAGRPNTRDEAHRIAYYLSVYYNAKILPEIDTGEVVAYFRKMRALYRVMLDPSVIINNNKVNDNSMPTYGVSMNKGENDTNSLIYLNDWLYTKRSQNEEGEIQYNYHYIKDIPTLLELTNYNLIANFDRISSLKLYPFALKARVVKNYNASVQRKESTNSIYAQIGLYEYET